MCNCEQDVFFVLHVLYLFEPDHFRNRKNLERKVVLRRSVSNEYDAAECTSTWSRDKKENNQPISARL